MVPTSSAVFQNPTLTESSPFGVFTVGNDGRVLSFNAKAAELWGRTPVIGQDFYYGGFRCFSMNGRELGVHEVPMAQAILRGLPTEEQEAIVERPDGTRATWLIRVDPVKEGEKILGAVAYFQAKETAPAFYEKLGEEVLPTLIGYVGSDLRYRFANSAFESWFGLNEREIVGRRIEEVLGAAAYAEIAPEMRLALDGSSQEFERFIPTAAGGSRFLLLRLVPDTAPGGFVRGTALIGSDVSASRREELEDLSQRKKFEAALAVAQIGTWAWDRRNGMVSWSESVWKILGLPRSQAPLGMEDFLLHFVPEAHRSALRDELQAGIASGKRFTSELATMPGVKPRWLKIEGFGAPADETPYVVGLLQDITEQVEKNLRSADSLEHLRYLTDNLPLLVWTFNGRELNLNSRWYAYTGDVRRPGKPSDPMEFVHPDDRDHVAETWTQCQKEDAPFEARYRLRRHDGVYRLHLGRIVPGYRENGVTTTWFGTATDIEEDGASLPPLPNSKS